MGQLDVTINKLGQLDLDNRTEYTTNFDIMKMAILAYFPVRENRMHFRRQDIEYSKIPCLGELVTRDKCGDKW